MSAKQGTSTEYYFRFGAATLDFRPNCLAGSPQVPIRRKTPPAHRQPLRNRYPSLRSSKSAVGRKMVENDCSNHTRASTTPPALKRALFSMPRDCSSLDDFGRIPLRRHQTGSSFPGWCSVLPTCFPDRCQPPEAGPIVRNIKHCAGKLLPVWGRHGGTRPKSSRLAGNSRDASRTELV